MLAIKLALLILIGTPLTLVVIGSLLWHVERRALLSAFRALGCPSCRAELSELSLKAADDLWQRHVRTIIERNPGVKLRLPARRLDAVCQQCGTRIYLDKKAGLLQLTTIVLAFETDGSDE